MQVQIDRTSRTVLAVGHFPTPPDDASIEVVDVAEREVAALSEPGIKTLEPDGTVIVTPPPPPAPLPPSLNDQLATALAALPQDTAITGAQLASVIALLRGGGAGQP